MEIRIEENVSLAEYTTLKVGGVARYFTVLGKIENLPAMIEFAESKGVSTLVLGGGSNMLIADGILPRLVIKSELKGINFKVADDGDTLVTASAGEDWDKFVEVVVERGLSGLENLSGIPGTVGAAPIQNINAYGASAGDLIDEVTVFDVVKKQQHTLNATECAFGYRDSLFKQPAGANLIVTAVTFRLAPARQINLSYRSASQSIEKYLTEKNIGEPTLLDIRRAILNVRKNIGMVAGCFHSAGSFFKNTIVSEAEFLQIEAVVKEKFPDISERLSPWFWPLSEGTIKVSTAFLMECTPYNKRTYGVERWHGAVGLSPLHSLSIVTEQGATATDVQEFSKIIIAAVKETFGIVIETEVNFVG